MWGMGLVSLELFTPKQGSDVSTEAKQNMAQGCRVQGLRAELALLLPRVCPCAGHVLQVCNSSVL